mgnify:CR=1 FL=1
MKRIMFVMMCFVVMYHLAFTQDFIITGPDDEMLVVEDDKIKASSYLKDSTNNDYGPEQAYDAKEKTAWCVGNGGIGEWIQFYFRHDVGAYDKVLKGKRNVYRVRIINGLAASRRLYYDNNRIKKLLVEFDSGERRVIELKDGILDYQDFIFNIRSRWIKLTIMDIYRGAKYNDTCLSEIDFRTIYDITDEERKKVFGR